MGFALVAVVAAAVLALSLGAPLRNGKQSKASFIEQLHNDPARREAFCNNLASHGGGMSCRQV